MAGISTDGDSKCLSAMCHQIVHQPDAPTSVQDTIHLAAKMRNRFVNKTKKLIMGKSIATADHLKTLIRYEQKSVHGLNLSDACPIDKQNFASVERIMAKRVTTALKKSVNGSEATVKYLELCSDISSSFLDHDMKPIERIFRMYRSLFFVRIWRRSILASPYYTLENNFISRNSYVCTEINALALINLVKKFRDTPQLFITPIFDSQTCEKTFRQLRSMGTVNYTRINFSLYDLLHMIGRIEAQNEIAYFKLSPEQVTFPSHKRSPKTQVYELPSDIEISETIAKAKEAAINDALAFGMQSENIDEYQIHSHFNFVVDDIIEEEETEENILFEEEHQNDDIAADFENENSQGLDPQSAFVSVINDQEKEVIIRKSHLIWMLTEPGVGLSKDRLRRVRVAKKRKTDEEI